MALVKMRDIQNGRQSASDPSPTDSSSGLVPMSTIVSQRITPTPKLPEYILPPFDMRDSELSQLAEQFATSQQENSPTAPDQRFRTDLPGGTLNPVNDINRFRNTKVGNFIDEAAQAAGRTIGLSPEQMSPAASTGNKAADVTANIIGSIGGYVTNPAQLEMNVGQTFFNNPLVNSAAERVAGLVPKVKAADGKLTNFLGNVAKGGVKGIVAGGLGSAAYAPSQTLISGGRASDVPGQVVEQGLMGAAIGGLLGNVGAAAGQGLRALASKYAGTKLGDSLGRFFNRGGNPEANQVVGEMLALPAPKPLALREGTIPSGEPIAAPGEIKTFELPAGNYIPPKRLKVVSNPDQLLNRVMEKIKPTVTERMTPPLENPNELAKWVQQHLGIKNISLNEVRQLSYDDLSQLAGEIKSRLSVADIATQAAKDQGYNLPKLLERQIPSVRDRVAQSATERAYGVYPETLPKLGAAKLNVFHENPAALPETKLGLKAVSTPKPSKYAKERAQILKSGPQPAQDVVSTAEPRIRDKVVNYMDEAAQAARDRLKAKRNTLSSNPVDQYADYAIIGASHIAKGAVKFADFAERMIADFGQAIKPHLKEIFNRAKVIHKDTELRVAKDMQGLNGIDPAQLKDHSGFKYNTSDVYRNFKDVFKDKYPQVKKAILDPFDKAKFENVKMQEEWLNKLYTEVVDKLGITKGSRLSALVQRFGEKKIDLAELKKLAPKDWEKVVKADQFFRKAYDELIDQVNKTRAQIYPHNPDKIVPKRTDYYRHFQDFNGLTGLKNLFDTPAGIDPHLVGISEFTQPKSKFAGFMQRRGLGPYKNDAVGGFLNYIPSASYATHIDPQIDVFKNLAKNLASETENTKNLNHFIEFLQKFSQDLAGKTNSLDRAFQEYVPGDRKTMGVINWANNRIKSNIVLGNVSSALSQLANVPQGIAFAKQYAFKGAGKTLISAMKGDPIHEQSQFLKERFIGKQYRKFDTKWLDLQNPLKLKNAAIWTLETADRLGTEFIWNSAYEKGLKEGVKNAVKYADDETRRLVAGRGIGEVPLMQKSKLFQLVAPFTLEVGNLWRVQKDFITSKDFTGLAILMLSSYVFNKVAEQVKGSGVMFDPIQAIVEASASGLTPLERGGRLAGEVASNLPLGSTLASIYPEYGTSVLPTRKELFGDNDPTRFGSGVVAMRGLQDPLYKALPAFGGNQLKKTVEGVQSIVKGGAYTGDKLKAPIDNTPLKAAQAVAFGPNATKEMQDYYNKNRRPLSEKQTEQLKALPKEDQKKAYEYLMMQRKMDSLQTAYDKVVNDPKMSDADKKKKIDALIKEYQNLTGTH